MSKDVAVTTEFRRDGFPLCPRCGDDELYSVYLLSREAIERAMRLERIPLDELMRHPFGCYYCQWTGKVVANEQA